MSKPLRIGFILCSPMSQPMPSTRMAVLNMVPYLKAANFDPCIIFEPALPGETPDLTGVAERAIQANCDVVVLQKVRGPGAVDVVRQLTAAHVPTVYAVCDRVDVPMVSATTATVTVTDFLRSLYPAALQSRIHVVSDGIERPAACKTDWGTGRGSRVRPLSAVLVTSVDLDRLPLIERPPPWLKVRIVGRYERGWRRLRETRWKWAQQDDRRLAYLRFLLHPRIACVAWESDRVYRELTGADIGVLPIDTSDDSPRALDPPDWKVKSENRLTLKMSMSLPVVATPIPSYEALIEHGVNGFFARSAGDWTLCLDALRDPARRREMGLAARASVERRYSMDKQSAALIRVLNAVGACGHSTLSPERS